MSSMREQIITSLQRLISFLNMNIFNQLHKRNNIVNIKCNYLQRQIRNGVSNYSGACLMTATDRYTSIIETIGADTNLHSLYFFQFISTLLDLILTVNSFFLC